jgi:hypothetical protein
LFVRGDDGVRLSQTAKIEELQEFRLTTERRRMHEKSASRAESLVYVSSVGSMLFIGHVTSPIAARMASSLASALPDLQVKDIKTMNAAIRKLKNGTPDIAVLFYPTIKNSIEKPIWIVFTDATFNEDVAKIGQECW